MNLSLFFHFYTHFLKLKGARPKNQPIFPRSHKRQSSSELSTVANICLELSPDGSCRWGHLIWILRRSSALSCFMNGIDQITSFQPVPYFLSFGRWSKIPKIFKRFCDFYSAPKIQSADFLFKEEIKCSSPLSFHCLPH